MLRFFFFHPLYILSGNLFVLNPIILQGELYTTLYLMGRSSLYRNVDYQPVGKSYSYLTLIAMSRKCYQTESMKYPKGGLYLCRSDAFYYSKLMAEFSEAAKVDSLSFTLLSSDLKSSTKTFPACLGARRDKTRRG